VIPLASLPDRPFAVLGLGLSGMSTCRALMASGRTVWAWDDNGSIRARAESFGVSVVDFATVDLRRAEALVLSPGIPHTWPKPHPLVAHAQRIGCPIIGDGELLARAIGDATFVGITGTNGKSTTTALIGHILQSMHRSCAVGGNLGEPVLDLAPLGTTGTYVLEMSSYQLELTPSLVFNVGVILNISPDHLDRHGGMEGYISAKRSIFRGRSVSPAAVIGVDDDDCQKIAGDIASAGERIVVPISGRRPVPGGVYAERGVLYDDTRGCAERILDLRTSNALPGEHNAQNAAAAFATVRLLGVEVEQACNAIVSFPGLAHRQERIATVDGVTYVNDSKATNADAAARALACYDSIYWIAGGRAKEGGLKEITPYFPRIRHAFLIGEAQTVFARELKGAFPISQVGTLDRAVSAATDLAREEGCTRPVVLLSPACASFDQFKNFEARGDAFRALVQALKS